MRRLLRSNNTVRRPIVISQVLKQLLLSFLGCACIFAVFFLWNLHSNVTSKEAAKVSLNEQISLVKTNTVSKVQFPQLQNQVRGYVDRFGKGRRIVFEVENLDADLSGNEGSGRFVAQLHPEWAPLGVERFVELVRQKFYDDCRIFRVVPNFVAQFGINGDPGTQKYWRDKNPIEDDPVNYSNVRGTMSFATSGPNSRTTQVFINVGEHNAYLDKEGFTPFAVIVEGMKVVDKLYSGYAEKPNQSMIQIEGNKYLGRDFPKLSYFKRVYLESLT